MREETLFKKKLMPIGVPRIMYCWGEEVPPQWTDIYNYIFRRRMVFLMQYLDDQLCNQIVGLLINIHMEDRSKEMEKLDTERSGVFKRAGDLSPPRKEKEDSSPRERESGKNLDFQQTKASSYAEKLENDQSLEDLLRAYNNPEDLPIDENYALEQLALQKITVEWLTWNAQFFDFADEPNLYELAQNLSNNGDGLDTQLSMHHKPNLFGISEGIIKKGAYSVSNNIGKTPFGKTSENANWGGEVYSPYRGIIKLGGLAARDKGFSMKNLFPNSNFSKGKEKKNTQDLLQQYQLQQKPGLAKLIGVLASKDFVNKNSSLPFAKEKETVSNSPNKALRQRNLRREYVAEEIFQNQSPSSSSSYYSDEERYSGLTTSTELNNSNRIFANKIGNSLNLLDIDSSNENQSYLFADTKIRNEYSRSDAIKALRDEEDKKVFVLINSFGGSVGNGITVHDALQFIRAGSLTLGMGVAASAASLVLAGGTISERYITEGCHVMIHQPEGEMNGQASGIWVDSQEIMRIRSDVAEIYSLSAHRPRHKILKDLDRDFYLTAIETIQYGIADEIATNEVMRQIISMTNKAWDVHDSRQERLLTNSRDPEDIDAEASADSEH